MSLVMQLVSGGAEIGFTFTFFFSFKIILSCFYFPHPISHLHFGPITKLFQIKMFIWAVNQLNNCCMDLIQEAPQLQRALRASTGRAAPGTEPTVQAQCSPERWCSPHLPCSLPSKAQCMQGGPSQNQKARKRVPYSCQLFHINSEAHFSSNSDCFQGEGKARRNNF